MPPISGTDPSVMYSLAAVARAGLVRAGTHSAKVFVKISGTQRAYNRTSSESRVTPESLKIKRSNGATPDTANCTVMGFVPGRLQEIEINLGSVNRLRHMFAGHILSSKQRYLVDTAQIAYDLACIDFAWELNGLVTGHFTGTADAIAIEWTQTYAPHFSSAKIQPNLPLIDGGISLTNVPLRKAFDRLVERFGGKWKSDYRRRILLGTSDYSEHTNPRTITASRKTFLFDPDAFYVQRDTSQRLTRMHFEGAGFAALAEIGAGETILPIEAAPASVYGDIGGEVIIGDSQQIVSYAGRAEGGVGTLIGTGAAPTTALVGELAAGSGVESGLHGYAYTFITASGETIPSPLASVTVGTVPAPTTAQAAALAVGTGMTTGDHYFAATFVTAGGETTASPISATVSAGPVTSGVIAAPVSAPTKTVSTTTGNLVAGARQFAVTFINGAGETTAGPTVSGTVAQLPPLGFSTSLLAGGSIDVGSPQYGITLVSATGETNIWVGGGISVTTGNNTVVVTVSNLTADPRATHFKVYRTTSTNIGGSTYFLLATVAITTGTQTYTDTTSDAVLITGATPPPSTDTASTGSIDLANLPIGGAGTTGRRVYGTVAGGSQLKLIATIANNTATTYTVNTADGSLGANVPVANTTGTTVNYNQVALTSIPIGPPATTARKIYMTAAGGTQLKLVTTIANNSATTLTVSTADGSLGANIPVSNTATANQVALTAIAIGPTGTTDRKIYRTVAAGSQLKLLTTLAGNVATTYTDSTADASLTTNAPTSDTSALAQPTGQVLPGVTTVPVASSALMPSAGWAVIGNGQQVIRYTGKTGTTLTGVPASGAGAVTSAVNYNSSITAAPALTGISSGSPSKGSITNTIPKGAAVNLWITVDNLDAQAFVQTALDPTDASGGLAGIIADVMSDSRVARAEAIARATSKLDSQDDEDVTVGYSTLDVNAEAGRTQVFDLASPLSVDETLVIQDEEVSWTDSEPPIFPIHTNTASSRRYTFEELLRKSREDR